jgi:hypothetical protein
MHSYPLTDEKNGKKKAIFSPWWAGAFGYCRVHCMNSDDFNFEFEFRL